MKKIVKIIGVAAAGALLVALGAFQISISKTRAATSMPAPTMSDLTVTNGANSVTITLDSPGPYSQDFRYTVCWDPQPNYNNPWQTVCTTTPWATDAGTAGAWSPWVWPGHSDEMGSGSHVYVSSIDTRALPASYLAAGVTTIKAVVGIQLSEDNNGSLTQNQIDIACPGSFTTFSPSATAYGHLYGSHCSDNSDTPDVLRAFIGIAGTIGTTVTASNLPSTMVAASQVTSNAGQPLSITVKNTGQTSWSPTFNEVDRTGTGVGECDIDLNLDGVNDAPQSGSARSQCAVTGDMVSTDYFLTHQGSNFAFSPEAIPIKFTGVTKITQYLPEHTIVVSCGFGGVGEPSAVSKDSNSLLSLLFNTAKAIVGGGGGQCPEDVPEEWNTYYTGGGYQPIIASGASLNFVIDSMTAPASPSVYNESWQMVDDSFGSVFTFPITVTPSSGNVSGVSVSCSPTSIATTDTSSCTATVSGSGGPSQAVTWSATGGSIDTNGVFTPSGAGTATITATSVQDSSKNGSTNVTVTATPATIIVSSANSILPNLPVNASWEFPVTPTASADPCGNASCNGLSRATYSNLPLGTYGINPVHASYYAFNSIERVPVAVAQKTLKDKLEAFAQTMLSPTANAFSFPLANPQMQTTDATNPTANFVILWDPIATMSLSATTLGISADSGAGPANSTMSVINSGAPGSGLTWTATSSQSWLNVSPNQSTGTLTNGASGNASESIAISADPTGLSVGTHTGTIIFSGTSMTDKPTSTVASQILTVTFTVNPPGGSGAGYNCVSNSCVSVASGATYPDANSCAAACGVQAPSCGGPGQPCDVCTFTASPTSLVIPQSSKLSYNCMHVSSCTLTGGSLGTISLLPTGGNVSGTRSIAPTTSGTYTLSCNGSSGGSSTNTVNVTVAGSVLCESNPGGTNCPKP